jgi:pepF/M3 family oligoendopeptidase
MSQPQPDLPHWDLTPLYASLDDPQFQSDFQTLIQSTQALAQQFDQQQINRVENATTNQETIQTLENLLQQYNQILQSFFTMQAYLYSFLSTDSRYILAQAKYSELQPHMAQITLLGTRLTAWIGSLDVEYLIAHSEIAQAHAYPLRRAQKDAQFLMSPIEEELASQLDITGSSSWYQMFSTYTSQLTVTVEIEGESQTLPLPAAQNLYFHTDRSVRERTHEAVLQTLQASTVPLAAALNAIKGETLTLAKRRGWDSPLEMALFNNAMDRQSLDAMMEACKQAFPDFQRYLKLRAKALGLPVLAWYDQLVPLGTGSTSWSWAEAQEFIRTQFGTYSPRMQAMAERAFAENWIDAEPRDGKNGGAFCMPLRHDESRILMNFEPSFASVGTLAHELGHAYHNVNLANRTPLQRSTPMTLAETASTFCQKIVENAALKTAVAQDRLIIVDGLLEYATRVILGSSSNFLFEQQLFEKRAVRNLSVEELCAMDVETQKSARGDAIAADKYHPYRWAYVPHYYGATFYNFPYIFGLLFGLGLYAQYQAEPESFKKGYDELLSATGMDDSAELAARFGINIRQIEFWQASLDVLRADIDQFEGLVAEVIGNQ